MTGLQAPQPGGFLLYETEDGRTRVNSPHDDRLDAPARLPCLPLLRAREYAAVSFDSGSRPHCHATG